MASTTDKFHKTGAATKTTLASPGKALAATSINITSATNWPTDTQVTFAIRQIELVDGEYQEVAGTYAEFNGIVSGTTITNMGTPIYGSDQVYPSGATTEVFIPVSSYAHNRLVDGILVGHNQTGTHKAFTESAIVPTAAIQDLAVTTAKIADANVTPAKRTGGFATGSFTRATNGAQVISSVTGFDFTPKLIKFYASFNHSFAASNLASVSSGVYDVVQNTQRVIGSAVRADGGAGSLMDATNCIRIFIVSGAGGGTEGGSAVCSAAGSGTFTLTWSSVGGTLNVIWEAYG